MARRGALIPVERIERSILLIRGEKITRMKDGRTHLVHKAEQAADNLVTVIAESDGSEHLSPAVLSEVVADKGYHSNAVLTSSASRGIRTYISEPDRGPRRWQDKGEAREAVYANRRRIRGERGKRLMGQRGELVERSFAHNYDTGGMRRTHLKGRQNISKRLLIHVAGFNLSLVLRRDIGRGTARGLQDITGRLYALIGAVCNGLRRRLSASRLIEPIPALPSRRLALCA